MTTPALHPVAGGPSPSANLLTLVELTQPPFKLGRNAAHLARKARDGRLHTHREPGGGSGVPHRVPEVVAWSFARGDDLAEQKRNCPLCATARPTPRTRQGRARH